MTGPEVAVTVDGRPVVVPDGATVLDACAAAGIDTPTLCFGDTVTARVEVTSLTPEKKFATFKTTCSVAGKIVMDGEATLMVPSKG